MKKQNGENIKLNDYLREFGLIKKNKNNIVVNNIDKSNSIKFKKDESKEKNKVHNNSIKTNTKTNNKNIEVNIKKIDLKSLSNIFKILTIITLSFTVANISFIIVNNNNYSNINEEFKVSITNSLNSPNTTVEINSVYDRAVNDTIYYYRVSDKLDAYTYLLKDSDVDDEFRKILLEKTLLNNTKNINMKDINLNEIKSILLHNDKYIINNKFNLNTSDISEKELKSIQSSILANNHKEYQNKRNIFSISGVVIGTLISTVSIKKRKQPIKDESVSI